MASSTVFPRATYGAGRRASLPLACDPGDNAVGVRLSRAAWAGLDLAAVLSRLALQVSRTGVSWKTICSCTTTGGIVNDEAGQPHVWTGLEARFARDLVGVLVRVVWDADEGGLDTEVVLYTGVWTTVEPGGGEPPASVAFDTAPTAVVASATSSITLSSVVIAANSDRLLLALSMSSNNPTVAVSTFKWNTSEDLTEVWAVSQDFSGFVVWNRCHRLIAPTATTANLVLTMAASVSRLALACGSFYNVDQTTPLGTPATNVGTADKLPVVSLGSGDTDGMAVGWAIFKNQGGGAPTIAASGGETERAEYENFVGIYCGSFTTEVGAAGGHTFNWTVTDTAVIDGWSAGAVSIKPAAAGGTPKGVFGKALHGPLRRAVY